MQDSHNYPNFQEAEANPSQKVRSKVREVANDKKGGDSCGKEKSLGGDSTPKQGYPSRPAPSPVKTQKYALSHLTNKLDEKDKAVLRTLRKYRFLLTGQIQRLYFYEAANPIANATATTRALRRIRGLGLIAPLERRIGGVRAGSASQVWHLTPRGLRMLQLDENGKTARKRFEEPSPTFLEHTLSVAETAVQIACLCRAETDMDLIHADAEPSCWRPFKVGGRTVCLKPDLFSVTANGKYKDHWFFEMDLGTEAASTVVEKCKVYRRYFNTGIEQKANRVFPLVVWLVKDTARKEKLREAMRSGLSPGPRIFTVITPDELAALIHDGAQKNEMI